MSSARRWPGLAQVLMRRKKMSPMSAGSQFQTTIAHPSNLDRCNRCGAARAAHGRDWTCTSGIPLSNGRLALVVITAGMLTALGVVGLLLATSADITLGSLAAACCLGGLTLAVGGVALAGRRR
jgi:hypothetical protein